MIYLDYAATAPLRPDVAAAMEQLHREPLGNPSSLHRAGRRARMHLETAREQCANLLGAKVEEIVFCSGATEADNLAVLGVLGHEDMTCRGVITSRLEHAAVYETAYRLEQTGTPVHWLRVDTTGRVDLDALEETLRSEPHQLVSVMVVNNEVGSRQPVDEVSRLCRQYGAIFHADAVQDVATARRLIQNQSVDLLALSGHKMGGLPGGMLFVRQGIAVNPQIVGGAQEDGRRAGTSDVARAVSLARALEGHLQLDQDRTRQMRARFEAELKEIEDATLLGPPEQEHRSSHISSWLFGNLPAEPVLAQLDLKGVCASSGSACSSHSVEPSRVVMAMGYPPQRATGLVRFSFGWQTDEDELQRAAGIVRETVQKMISKERVKR